MKTRKLWLAVWTGLMMLLLTGCFFRSVDQLYAVPQPPPDYEALRVRLSEVIAMGGEYAAPLSGDMIQSVQLQDLDGDGRQEAIAFFRFINEEKPLKIYMFRQVGDSYETMGVIEGAATAVNYVDYVQMDDEVYKEVVISWQLTAQVHALAVYSVGPDQVEEILRTDYDSYKLTDLDQDNQQELVVFRTPPEAAPRAELYDFDGVLTLVGEAPLSTGAIIDQDGVVKADYLTTIQVGYLADRVPAVFATSTYGEAGAITDIFIVREGKLKNVTLSPATGESGETVRYYTQAGIRDVNGDGIMEVPQPVPLADVTITGNTVNFWIVRWRQFASDGSSEQVMSTYYNDRDGWYFVLPDEWEKNLSLSRSDVTISGERAVTFSWREEGGVPAPFLTIYKLTGTNRTIRARRGQRFVIPTAGVDDGSTIYAAEFRDGWDCGLSQEEVIQRFAVIRSDWYNG